MKIAIGINGFKKYEDLEKRERFCIESLLKIKSKNPNIELYNVCFQDEDISYEGFTTLNKLTVKSNELIKEYFKHDELQKDYQLHKDEIDSNKKELPSVKEIFDVLAATDCDYFLFLNNDIILSNRVLKEIDENAECYPMSRMHIHDIESLDEIPKLESYSVHGFDAFLIKKETWLQVCNNFEHVVLGRFYWDTYFFTVFNLFCKCKNINKLPPVCFHIEHNSVSSTNTIENYYNESIFKKNLIVGHLWFSYVQNILLKRPTVAECKWYQPFTNEEQIEKHHFNQFSTAPKLFIENYKPIKLTTKTDYDIFIPLSPKDEIKLPYVLDGILQNLVPKNIYVCSPHTVKNKIKEKTVTYINDKDVINIADRSFIKFRPNWTYAQFLKTFFSQGQSDYYFVIDSDAIVLKPFDLFIDEHPVWYYGPDQNHLPYFLLNKKAFNINKVLPHTGISDTGFFNKQISKEALKYTNKNTPEELLQGLGGSLNNVFHFADYEFYPNFAETFYPSLYKFKQFKQKTYGRNLDNGENWSIPDIEKTIKDAKIKDLEVVTLHTWKI